MGLVATKPVFGISDKGRLKPVSSATDIEILLEASLDMILSSMRLTNALISLRGCAGWSVPLLCATPRTGFVTTKLMRLLSNYQRIILKRFSEGVPLLHTKQMTQR